MSRCLVVTAGRAAAVDTRRRVPLDGVCFEINPVTWFTLATHGITVRGEPTAELAVHLDEADMRHWVRDNVDTYWRGVRDQIVNVLAAEQGRDEFDAGMTEWCALGIARMLYSIDIGGVASKSEAGSWAAVELPSHEHVLRRALGIRREVSPSTVDRALVEATVSLMTGVIDHVTA